MLLFKIVISVGGAEYVDRYDEMKCNTAFMAWFNFCLISFYSLFLVIGYESDGEAMEE